MSILTRLFGSKNRPARMQGQPPSARSLLKARTPPWHQVAPKVIDAIFEALDHTELFDCFVLSSMENKLVARYEQSCRDEQNVSVVRAKISAILCQAGFRKIAELENELNNNRIDAARKIGFAATNLFEPAITMSKDQIAGYIGMATIFAMLGVRAQCHDYARRGLLELQKIKQSAAGQAIRYSAVFPPDMLDQEEQQLFSFLKDTTNNPEPATLAPPAHEQDDTTRIGRRGICVLCGTMKSGSIVQCQECGFMPTSDAQLVMALMLNEAQMGNFEQFANAIKSGARPEFSERDIQKVAETLPELRRMIGLQSPQDYTRELTERFLTDAVGMATHGLADTITHGVPGELSELSKERMLVVLGCIIKDQLLRRAPVGERNFIERVFGKRLALMSKHSGLPALAGVLQVEFAVRVEQAAAEFDAGAFEFSTDWQTLENTIISFVLPKMDAVREYMRNSERDPYAGRNLVRIAHLHAKAMAKNSEKWS